MSGEGLTYRLQTSIDPFGLGHFSHSAMYSVEHEMQTDKMSLFCTAERKSKSLAFDVLKVTFSCEPHMYSIGLRIDSVQSYNYESLWHRYRKIHTS